MARMELYERGELVATITTSDTPATARKATADKTGDAAPATAATGTARKPKDERKQERKRELRAIAQAMFGRALKDCTPEQRKAAHAAQRDGIKAHERDAAPTTAKAGKGKAKDKPADGKTGSKAKPYSWNARGLARAAANKTGKPSHYLAEDGKTIITREPDARPAK